MAAMYNIMNHEVMTNMKPMNSFMYCFIWYSC